MHNYIIQAYLTIIIWHYLGVILLHTNYFTQFYTPEN